MSVITAAPEPEITSSITRMARVAVVRTRTDTVIEDYGRVMDMPAYQDLLSDHRAPGIADPRQIDLVDDDGSRENFKFQTRRSPVIWGDQMIRRGFLRTIERLLLHSPLMAWAPFASNVYHDLFWYPTIGRSRIRSFMRTEWGQLFRKY